MLVFESADENKKEINLKSPQQDISIQDMVDAERNSQEPSPQDGDNVLRLCSPAYSLMVGNHCMAVDAIEQSLSLLNRQMLYTWLIPHENGCFHVSESIVKILQPQL